MKKITFIICYCLLLAGGLFAQNPCDWMDLNFDTAATQAARQDFNIHKLRLDQGVPEIDGKIDKVWEEFQLHPLNIICKDNGETNFASKAVWMYDSEWLYLLVVVSGEDEVKVSGITKEVDRVELMFQNKFGGKGTDADHCNGPGWNNWYWEADGDRKFIMPVNPENHRLTWLDQDIDGICATDDCGEIEMVDWLTLKVTDQVQYKVYTNNTDSIVYEMAFNWINFLKYSATPEIGYDFGFEIQVRDAEGADSDVGKFTLNDICVDGPDVAWFYPKALAKFTVADTSNGSTDIINKKLVNIKTYPNPVNTNLNVICDNNISIIDVYNVLGQSMFSLSEINCKQTKINVENLTKGIYFITIYSEDEYEGMVKFIKY